MRYSIGLAFVGVAFLVAAVPGGGATSSPSPTPTPLTIFIQVSSSSPSPVPKATSVPIELVQGTKTPVIYVFAIGAPNEDPSATNKMLAGVSERLQGMAFKRDATLIPMPGWSIEEFASVCREEQSDFEVAGGFVIRVLAVSHWLTHRIFQEARTTAIDADALYIRCEDHSIAITWHDGVEYTLGTTGTTNLAPLALLLPAVATYQGFIAGKTQQSTYENKETGQTTTTTTTYNPAAASNAGQISGALVTASLNYTQVLTSTPPPISDEATWKAVNLLSAQIVADTECPTPMPAPTLKPPTPSPSPSPVPNPTPTLPPPMSGATKAPFCK